MKVRVVTPYKPKGNQIIARLARHLTKYNGWAVRSTPHPRAVVNLFMPYTHWRFSKWERTPTAAWFTHKERRATEGGAPLRRWEMASKAVDLRVTPAKLYVEGLAEHGRTIQIEHPVELKHFTPKPKPHKGLRIGVSGRVYPGGRKGEKLLRRLYREQRHRWTVVASGRGWHIPGADNRLWEAMPNFYRSLDVFLCTSLIEGGPVTVLEALACGKPVVIPKGVGALDELPEMVGIWRYEKGNYGSMVEAIDEALKWPVAVGELRAIVEHRGPQRWARQWREALEGLIADMAA